MQLLGFIDVVPLIHLATHLCEVVFPRVTSYYFRLQIGILIRGSIPATSHLNRTPDQTPVLTNAPNNLSTWSSGVRQLGLNYQVLDVLAGEA